MRGRRQTISQWCRELKIHKETLKKRFAKTGDWHKAAKEARRNITQESIIAVTIGGVTKTAREWCKEYRIRFQKAWSRVHRDGMAWEQAITTKTIHQKDRKFKKTIKVTINGKTQSIRQWSKELQVPMGTIHKRMKSRGMTPKEALLAERRINQHK